MATLTQTAPPAPALSPILQSIARNYLGARQRAGEAWLETARYLAEARAAARHGEWYVFLEATQTSSDVADRLLAIHDQAERDPQYEKAIRSNFLNQSTAYELASAPEPVRQQLLTGDQPPTRAQIRDAKRAAHPAPARDFEQPSMFDAPAPAEPPAPAAAQRLSCPTCGEPILNGIWGDRNECGSCYQKRQRAGVARCARCGATRAERQELTTYEAGMVPEYPDNVVSLCNRCIPELLSARKQALATLDEQLPPALFKEGYFWQSATPPTIAHNAGNWRGSAPTVEQALQLARDHLRMRRDNDPRAQAAQLLRQLTPLLRNLPAPLDQGTLSMAISDLNECLEGTEAEHWLTVGWALIGIESEEK